MAPGAAFPVLLTLLPLLPLLCATLPLLHPAPAPAPPRIALLHMHDSVSFFARLGNLTAANKARYAARHGYDLVLSTPLRTAGVLRPLACRLGPPAVVAGPDRDGRCWGHDNAFDIDHSRAPTFGKLKLALAACRGRRDAWLLWTDADAMVVNHSVPLEALIDDAYDIMLAYDWLMLNAGMLLLKCSDWGQRFLAAVYHDVAFDNARALDQSALQQHLDNLPRAEHRAHVKVLPKWAMNVYTEEYRPGDFLLHMAGKLYEATEPGLFAIANQFDALSMVDDVEDIRAFFRGRHLLNYYSGTCVVRPGERQSSCNPDDPRRVLLNESLGSMSYPNRYRHVGLRYYWLGDWADQYDVPGWDIRRKPLPLLPRNAPADMPPPPPASRHHPPADPAAAPDVIHDAALQHDDDKVANDHPPEVDHDTDVHLAHQRQKPPNANDVGADDDDGDGAAGARGARGDDDDDDGDADDGDAWPLYVWVIVLSIAGSTMAAAFILYKRRRTKSGKIQ